MSTGSFQDDRICDISVVELKSQIVSSRMATTFSSCMSTGSFQDDRICDISVVELKSQIVSSRMAMMFSGVVSAVAPLLALGVDVQPSGRLRLQAKHPGRLDRG